MNVSRPIWLAMPLVIAAMQVAVQQDPAPATDPRLLHFEAKVRPLLVNRCEECHAETAEGNLRVDSLAALLKGGDAGPAIVVGNPDASVLLQAVRHTGDIKMPKKRTRLTAEEVDAMAQWIRDGAVWPAPTPGATNVVEQRIAENRAFWSFRPLELPAVPTIADDAWPRTDIDRFVLARLETEGLRPVAKADRRTWLRRVTYDLTGLPPTPAETKAFLADASPDAETTVVDRLLATPTYSEHWARWWLDVARYAEDDCRSLDPEGRGFNPYPNAYLYRDWVIQAFADDLPFDQFLSAQLAADQLEEPARTRHLPALGFLGLGPWYYDNGSVEVTRADERHDRVDAVSRGMLGLTAACARCHDHKFDPISTADYYSLAGVFLNTRYHEYPQVPKAVAEDWQTRHKRIEQKSKLLAESRRIEVQQTAESLALQTTLYMTAAWQVLGPPRRDKSLVATQGKLDYELFDRWLAFLQKPPKHYGYLRAWQDLIERQGTKEEAQKIAADFQTQLLDIMFAMKEIKEENEIIRAKALPGTKKKERAKLPSDFVTNDDFCPGCGLELKSLPKEQANLWSDVFARDLEGEFESENSPEARQRPGLFVFEGHALARQLSAERRRYLDDLKKDIAAAKKELGPKFPFVHGVEDLPELTPIKVHLRGSPFRLGDEVPRRFPAVLQSLPLQPFQKGSGRRELAERIVSHPLTARVFVNRVWKQHFGTGIVETPSDFGLKGERPSHPELLEHLATLFQAHGSLKELHRQILRSAVYGLGAFDNELAQQKDPNNRLYWRANERRLSAEQLRDSMLAVAGTLDTKPGGPSAKLTLQNRRRTIYGQISRYSLDPYLALFDFPSPSSTSERRFVTNVAPQRLFLMNSDFVQEQAERTAERVAKASGDATRIAEAYNLLFQRDPTAAEVTAGLAYLQQEPMRQVDERKAIAAKAAQDAPPPAPLPPPPPGFKPANHSTEAIVQPLAAPTKEGDKDAGRASMDGDEDAGDEKEPDSEVPDPARQPLPITVWGRYVKVLLCSNEFLFLR